MFQQPDGFDPGTIRELDIHQRDIALKSTARGMKSHERIELGNHFVDRRAPEGSDQSLSLARIVFENGYADRHWNSMLETLPLRCPSDKPMK
jgi:hypothetical protein